jgi:endonuclease-3
MRNKRTPPRQPLSRSRPKVASKKLLPPVKKPKLLPREAPTKPARRAGAAAAIATSVGKKVARIPASRRAPPATRAPEIFARLHRTYPDAHCALDFQSPFQLLVATILSAQCTDKRVNMVTPALFRRYPTPEALSVAKTEELEEMIKSTGFFRNKAKSLVGMATAIAERHGGVVPSEMEQLVGLPGVGRKTANVILGNAFERNDGIVVDTHVTRVSQRLALTTNTDPVKIEQDLMPLFPRDQWTLLAHLFIEHGRQICIARAPKCEQCPLSDLCPSSRV